MNSASQELKASPARKGLTTCQWHVYWTFVQHTKKTGGCLSSRKY